MEIPSIFLNRILVEAAKKNASNLHIAVGSIPVMRIDDQLVAMSQEGIVSADLVVKIVDSFLTDEEKVRLQESRELKIVKTFAGSFRFRVNVYFQKDLPSLSFNSIPSAPKSISELKLPAAINNLIKSDSGLFIVAGPQLSGKTATSAAIIEEINKSMNKRIVTLEDPIEYQFVSKKSIIEQRQAGRDMKSIIDGVDYCLNEDVDAVCIGEVKKDFDSAVPDILNLASGNAFVIFEINTDSSIRVLERMLSALKGSMSQEAARYSLADILTGVIVQKLVPRVGGGMVLAHEMLLVNPAVKSLIREGRIYQIESIMQTSRREGMVSMEKSLEELARAGEIKENFRVNLT